MKAHKNQNLLRKHFIHLCFIFLIFLMWQFKVLNVFHQTNLINENTSYFQKKIEQKCFKCCRTHQNYLIQQI